jgi:hypothetical protein
MEKKIVAGKFIPIAITLAIGSFCIYPVQQLQLQYRNGKETFAMADAIKNKFADIERLREISSPPEPAGSFHSYFNMISVQGNSDEMIQAMIVNFLLKGKYFGLFVNDPSPQEIMDVAKRYGIDYCIYYYHSPAEKDAILKGLPARSAIDIIEGVPGIIILVFKYQVTLSKRKTD